jgi:hypothetical protein
MLCEHLHDSGTPREVLKHPERRVGDDELGTHNKLGMMITGS